LLRESWPVFEGRRDDRDPATNGLDCCLCRAMTTEPDDVSRIHISGIHLDLTAALQNAIREKFAVLLRHHERIIRISVRLNQDQTRGQKHHYSATAHMEIGGPDIVATVKGDDAYNVVDGLVEKLDERLRERHERRKDRRNHPHETEIDAELPKFQTPSR
jgi:putative sigma-54 modulation protein